VTPRTMTRKKTVGDGRYSSKAFYQADLGARHKNGKHVERTKNRAATGRKRYPNAELGTLVVSLPAGRGSATPSKGSTFMSHTELTWHSSSQYGNMQTGGTSRWTQVDRVRQNT
jgi:hypothetical protein